VTEGHGHEISVARLNIEAQRVLSRLTLIAEQCRPRPGGVPLTKSDREIMGILEAFDLTRCAHSAARLAGVDEKTVARYVAIRDSGADPLVPIRRPRSIDAFLGKIEELVARSDGRIRADVVHERLVAMGFTGSDRGTRRAVAEAKAAWRDGHRPADRPLAPEPGMWLQFCWSEGPRVSGRGTQLFHGWLPWSRYRFVIPTWDRTRATLRSAMDTTLRGLGGAPTYLVTDDSRMLTVDRGTGAPVRHPELVSMGRYYGCQVLGCQPFAPGSVGGSVSGGELTAKIARDDLVPTTANLLAGYDSFVELAQACALWCDRMNNRPQRKTGTTPTARLVIERQHLHALPAEPAAAARGELRLVETDRQARPGAARYARPDGRSGERGRVAAGVGARQRL
jgi:transposase